MNLFFLGAARPHNRTRAAEPAFLHLGREALEEAVSTLRRELDPTGKRRGPAFDRGQARPPAVADPRRGLDIPDERRILLFDRSKAYELYRKIFAPSESLLEGARHVFVVSAAGLQSLPFGV